ncbi:MAG: hypothetical protein LUG18_05900 [Candidatus Azobacteroides sp.]|nr:hypothetical protein [Candidatus Azobacteroides sp.]
MKRMYAVLFLLSALFPLVGQDNILILNNQNILFDAHYFASIIQVDNVHISNHAVVNLIGEEKVSLTNFSTEGAERVVIQASGNISSVSSPEVTAELIALKVYSIHGIPVYYSEKQFDLKEMNPEEGVYILEKRYSNGEVIREQLLWKR